MGTATQPKNKFTQLTTKIISSALVPQYHFTTLMGKEVQSPTEQIKWESREKKSRFARDVVRNTQGNDNKNSKWTEKMINGAEFHEKININQILAPMIQFGEPNDKDSGLLGAFATEVKKQVDDMIDMMANARERACAQYFNNGVISYDIAGDYDFNRPGASQVDLGAGGYWSNVAAPIEAQASAMRTYFRNIGLFSGGRFNWTMSEAAWINLKETDFFNKEKKNVNYSEIERLFPSFSESGATLMGRFEVAGAVHNIWTYDGSVEGAQTGGASMEPYMDPTKVVITPVDFEIGEITYFPIDSAMAGAKGLPKVVKTRIHQWDELKGDSDTYVRHAKSRVNPVAYYEKKTYTLKVLA